jgi:hypothetical protein
MKRETAEIMMSMAQAINQTTNTFSMLLDDGCNNEERIIIRKAIAETWSSVYEHFMKPAISAYPDLDPDK